MTLQLIVLLALYSQMWRVTGQSVQLKQGSLRGSARVIDGQTVFTFRGVPYAEPPTGIRRFRPAAPHSRWEGTYSAIEFKPPCPQPSGSRVVRDTMDEDCLYLNIWTNVIPRRLNEGRPRPVVVFLEGQLFTLGNPADIPAEDFVANQDVVFVSVNYRVNAFGFLSWEDNVLPGNMGLTDQSLAIAWVYENIESFGGNRNQITLMGHSAGAASTMFHVISSRSNSRISRAIMMSGSGLAPWALQQNPRANARRLAQVLGCSFYDSRTLLSCLQGKRVSDIVSAVDDMIRDGNTSAIFGPVVDNYLPSTSRFFEISPEIALERGLYKKIPMLSGLVFDDGVLMAYFLKEIIDRLSIRDLRNFVDSTLIPATINQLSAIGDKVVPRDVISFQYFGQYLDARDKSKVFDDIIDFYNEAYFMAPLERQMNLIHSSGGQIHFYLNTYRSADIFGNQLNRTTASHGSDLLYLFGPEMYQKFFIRRFQSFAEERLSRNLKTIFGNFISSGTPIANLLWKEYTVNGKDFFDISSNAPGRNFRDKAYQFWYNYLPRLNEYIEDLVENPNYGDGPEIARLGLDCNTYITFTWLLLAAILVLFVLLIAMAWMIYRKPPEKDFLSFAEPTQSVFSLGARSSARSFDPGTSFRVPPQTTRSRWRESVTTYKL
ncbi:cholinesterase-like [Tigriopus californicus]|nr:cholinesterase-like [Tigriopus californicus]|eukprot:TCALIF_12723-PA protein Name:"Similar to ACHE Acetylcholinesterase (Bungarus fasciatus)" AED:0.19 eAED:0.19 QI:176/0.71/0.5/0.75/0.71/0.75/8/0/658